MIDWNKLRDKAHENSVKHGFWDNRPSDNHFLCLVISELMEAVEADRKRNMANIPYDKKGTLFDPKVFHPQNRYFRSVFEDCIKDTVEDELADAIIRILDLAGANGINMNICDTVYPLLKQGKRMFTEDIYQIVQEIVRADNPIEVSLNMGMKMICKLATSKGIDLLWHVEQKMLYNENRESKHGKQY
nr:MAG: dUTPase [Bacteriophage sp.]